MEQLIRCYIQITMCIALYIRVTIYEALTNNNALLTLHLSTVCQVFTQVQF